MTKVDLEVVERASAGDMSAFRQIVEAYDRTVMSLLVDRVGAREDVFDLRQEVFYRIFKGLRALRQRDRLSAWVRGVCRNVVREYWTSRARSTAAIEESVEPAAPTIDEDRVSIEYAITKALAVLPSRYREVLRLRYFAKLDYEQIAETLGMSLMGVDALMRRAKARLREAVSPILEREDIR